MINENKQLLVVESDMWSQPHMAECYFSSTFWNVWNALTCIKTQQGDIQILVAPHF